GNQYPIRGNQYSGYRNRRNACVWKLKRWHPEGNNPYLYVCDLSRCFKRRALLSVLYRVETSWFPDRTRGPRWALWQTAAVAPMPQPSRPALRLVVQPACVEPIGQAFASRVGKAHALRAGAVQAARIGKHAQGCIGWYRSGFAVDE